ncbi:MFS general substrate transporter [Aspergillus campestris IBT 28561]|uniref:MFS general substrate transporter n=1 Tax=Aspergillus campestris (strain IBT 28561) TaxID=1392248 RepID=A0A2I1CRI3_ASPC2|nr:MFS general substrate transporter [Aspergillus campestris IBT 28561]PKY00234.1 MFS general substrate transporter [Aspergillus campestris IBT 28561]
MSPARSDNNVTEKGHVEPDADAHGSEGATPPDDTESLLPRWNHPRSNIFRVFTTLWVFLVMGANDAAYGALLPYLEEYYNITYMIVSLVFLSSLVGYVLSALINDKLHLWVGQRGVGFIASVCHLIGYIISCTRPPYPALVVAYIFAGIANGLGDAAWNTYIGNMQNSNELLGLLHGVYGLGAVISPLVVTNMVKKANVPWNYFYFFMIGIAAVEFILTLMAFWRFTGAAFRKTRAQTAGETNASLRSTLFSRPAAHISWVCAILLLFYVGVEVAVGGWVVTFMIDVRHAAYYASGMTATGFWLGITVGRVVLGFVTARLGVKLATTIYISCSIGVDLVLWLVPNFYASAVAAGFLGFFLGPLFPAVVQVMTVLLPKHLHVTAIGFVAAFGGSGAAVIPFIVGAIAQNRGVESLMPFVVALSVAILLLWMALPRQDGSGSVFRPLLGKILRSRRQDGNTI